MKMSSLTILTTLLAVLASLANASDEDFAFDITDDMEVEFAPSIIGITDSKDVDIKASVGKIFHLAITKDIYGSREKVFEVSIN